MLNALYLCERSAEVQLKICSSLFDCAKVELLQVYFRCTLKADIIQRSYNLINSDIKHISGIILINVHCAIVLPMKFN